MGELEGAASRHSGSGILGPGSIFAGIAIASFVALSLAAGPAATPFWVSPEGTAAWAAARSETPLAGAACSSLATANANAAAGDTVYLRGGTYGTGIRPANSGSAGNVILFAAYPGEIPTMRVAGARAVTIVGTSYIRVDGIHSSESQAFFLIGSGACFNEITNCVFDKSSGQYSLGLISFYDAAFKPGAPSDHNWIHNNVFSRYGKISSRCNDNGTVRISGGRADMSSHNTFEDNVFSHGGHDNLDVGGNHNVVRDNIFHNEESYYEDTTKACKNTPVSGHFGNRNVIITNYGDGPGTARDNLIEGNRIGYAGTPPDDDGAMGVENAGLHTVVRYNDIYRNGASGYYSKMQGVKSGSWARVYNNTIYANGFGDPSLGTGYKYGVTIWSYRNRNDWPENVVVLNNIVFKNRGEWRVATDNILPQVAYANNLDADPGFVNDDVSDPTSLILPDLRLRPGSRAVDSAAPLTAAVGSGTSSTRLTVRDAFFFQDGTWGASLSSVQADWIAVGRPYQAVRIRAIDLKSQTIDLAEPISWSDKAPVWLFRDSKGRRVFYGLAPDRGAHEQESPQPVR